MTTSALPSRQAAPELSALAQALSALKLDRAADALPGLLSAAVSDDLSGPAFLQRVLAMELGAREESRIKTSLRLSGLPLGQTISNFDFAFQPAIERSRVESLATCSWVRDKMTTLLLGPPGVGKTHLAIALGVKAVEAGFSVIYLRIEDLLHLLRHDAQIPPAQLRRRKYMNVALLIVDEVGFGTFTRDEANLFFRMVSYRYQRGAICITSNKAVKDWPEMLAGDEVITSAVLDRLLHSSHVLNIRGRSYRLKELEASLNSRS
jgi:DNA replication protein DnaC